MPNSHLYSNDLVIEEYGSDTGRRFQDDNPNASSFSGYNSNRNRTGQEGDYNEYRDVYFASPNRVQATLRQQHANNPPPTSRRKKVRSRYDEDNYALADSQASSASDISSQGQAQNETSQNNGKVKWKTYSILFACLAIGISAGVAITVIVLRNKGNPSDSTNGINLKQNLGSQLLDILNLSLCQISRID